METQSPPSAVRRRGLRWRLLVLGVLLLPIAAHAQEPAPAPETQSSIDTTVTNGEAEPRRKLVKWNEYDGPITTIRLGFGFLVDVVDYNQDGESVQQIGDLTPDYGLRDMRLLLKGKFKTKRPISWMVGYMYDGADDTWHFRQTGVDIGIPELKSRLFFGRTKEGYSLIKVMTGYYGWLNERSQSNDAFVPILGDGLKLQTYLPKPRLYLSLGGYGGKAWENEKFATADNLVAGRLAWLPVLSDEKKAVLHLGVMGRLFHPDGGSLQVRARGGSYLGPYFLDTGKFASDDGEVFGAEAFYRKGAWMFGSELNREKVHAITTQENPVFWGGDAVGRLEHHG
jgi:phosphate-selective porin OprO/OprP